MLRKDRLRTVVQAKRYSKAVGIKAVQEVVAAKGYYDCDECLVVSNRNYTKPAQELAHKNNVELWDRDMLIEPADRDRREEPAARRRENETARVVTNATRFGGQMLCFRHQRPRRA